MNNNHTCTCLTAISIIDSSIKTKFNILCTPEILNMHIKQLFFDYTISIYYYLLAHTNTNGYCVPKDQV